MVDMDDSAILNMLLSLESFIAKAQFITRRKIVNDVYLDGEVRFYIHYGQYDSYKKRLEKKLSDLLRKSSIRPDFFQVVIILLKLKGLNEIMDKKAKLIFYRETDNYLVR
jgi:hypothetical protein